MQISHNYTYSPSLPSLPPLPQPHPSQWIVLQWPHVSVYPFIFWGEGNGTPLQSSCGEGSGTPLQYFCLENPMDGGAW